MIKMIVLLRRHLSLTREEFSHHWRNIHAPLVQSVPQLTRHMTKYVQNHIPLRAELRDNATAQEPDKDPQMDFDGIVEIWFDTLEDVVQSTSSDIYHKVIRADELSLVDMSKSVMFLTEEYVVFDEVRRPYGETGATNRKSVNEDIGGAVKLS